MARPFLARATPVALSIALVLSALVPFLVGPAAALVQGDPNVSLTVADNRVAAGETTTLEVTAVNRGDLEQGSNQGNVQAENRVTTARGVTLTPQSNGPITVQTNEVAVGSLSDGAIAPATFEIAVAEDTAPGTYSVPVDLEYRYTSTVSEQGVRSYIDETVTVERTVRVVVDEDARFEVVGVDALGPGESGTFALDVENTGSATANDAVVSLSSLSSDVVFGEGEASQAYVAEWEPGERRTLSFRGSVAENAPVREVPASLAVEYTDGDAVAFASESTFGLEPAGDQTFAFEPGDSNLRVGQEGTVRGTLTNEGPEAVENVVVTLQPPSQNAVVLEPELAVEDLDPGESVPVSFDVEVSSEGRSGPRQFSLVTDYETVGGDDLTSDPIRFTETVEPSRDVFDVEATQGNVTVGGTERIVLSVTNDGDETVTDVSAKLFASSPLSAGDDEAFVAELQPGETVEIPFRVSAADGAMAKDYPISVDFQYVDDAGETRLTDSYRLPVTVEADDGGFLGLFGLSGLFGLVGTAGVTVLAVPLARRYRRR